MIEINGNIIDTSKPICNNCEVRNTYLNFETCEQCITLKRNKKIDKIIKNNKSWSIKSLLFGWYKNKK